jgi:hypothetical protein
MYLSTLSADNEVIIEELECEETFFIPSRLSRNNFSILRSSLEGEDLVAQKWKNILSY